MRSPSLLVPEGGDGSKRKVERRRKEKKYTVFLSLSRPDSDLFPLSFSPFKPPTPAQRRSSPRPSAAPPMAPRGETKQKEWKKRR